MGGGGDAPSVPPWDMAVLVGASLMLATLFIATWTQPVSHAVDGPTEILTIHSGLAEASLRLEAQHGLECTEADPCDALRVYVLAEGQSLSDVTPVELLPTGHGEHAEIALNDRLDAGAYRIVLDGEGSYDFEATVNRTVPHEYVPAILGALLLVWGIWRGQQEDEA